MIDKEMEGKDQENEEKNDCDKWQGGQSNCRVTEKKFITKSNKNEQSSFVFHYQHSHFISSLHSIIFDLIF